MVAVGAVSELVVFVHGPLSQHMGYALMAAERTASSRLPISRLSDADACAPLSCEGIIRPTGEDQKVGTEGMLADR